VENTWLVFAKRLHALSSTGIHFTKDEFDKERYEEIQSIAAQMMSLIGEIPIQRIHDLVTTHSKGYVTPKIDVRGAVFLEDKLLLVREKSDGLWTLPGGFADVGLSAAQNIAKEIEEEAGIKTSARMLYQIRHKSKGAYDPDIRDFYKLFFVCEQLDEGGPSAGVETDEARYFDQSDLPPLSTGRVSEHDIELAWQFNRQEAYITAFD